ncbi:hypothetical protein [Coleofasciculus sp.]|uniref:hypothetical protein n=1 Tax=Coleofasciculus sp. TaxID=3100458 RepID=UPI003A25E8F7
MFSLQRHKMDDLVVFVTVCLGNFTMRFDNANGCFLETRSHVGMTQAYCRLNR